MNKLNVIIHSEEAGTSANFTAPAQGSTTPVVNQLRWLTTTPPVLGGDLTSLLPKAGRLFSPPDLGGATGGRSPQSGWLNCGRIVYVILIVFILPLASCNQHQPTPEQAVGRFKTYKGVLNVYADAGFETIMNLEKEVFEFHYDSVTANLIYADEPAAIDAYRKSKKGVLIIGRQLDSAELVSFEKNDTLFVRQLDIAYGAVALIGNKSFDDNQLDVETLKKYFDPNNKPANAPQMVFDKQSSGIVKFMLKKLGYQTKISPNLFAVATTDDVINYVAQNKNAIGFIPFNYISDTDNEKVKAIYDRIKVLSLRSQTRDGQAIRVSANQSDIAEGVYPFIRPITAITHYGFDDDLDWLFIYFMYRDKGSKVFLKHGLIPAKRTEREINVNTEGISAKNG